MICSKEDLRFYLKCDEIARFKDYVKLSTKLKSRYCWKFNVVLRKMEYNLNCNNGLKRKIFNIYYRYRMSKIAEKTNWYVSPNCFGPGLCIVHYGTVIVNERARFGSNIRIQAMVNIGDYKGGVPHGGDNIYIGPGAKLYGNVLLGSNIAIGANSVVNKSFEKSNVTIAGIPAKIISDHGTNDLIIDAVTTVKSRKMPMKT